jgi:hypothetical protein
VDRFNAKTSLVATMVRHVERGLCKFITCMYMYSYQGHKISPPQPIRSCHSPWRHWSAPCVENGRHTFMHFKHIRAISTAICWRKVTKLRRNRHASGQKRVYMASWAAIGPCRTNYMAYIYWAAIGTCRTNTWPTGPQLGHAELVLTLEQYSPDLWEYCKVHVKVLLE